MKALRLSVGLLTVIPVGDVGEVDRRLARSAMLLAPLVGLLLGALAALVLIGVRALVPSALGALLASVLAITTLAYLTRALHLDGLADTADALGSGKRGDAALEIAKRGDVGPFGVVTLVLMLLVQITALAVSVDASWGAACLIVAIVTGRVAAVLACMRGIVAARPEGLGALVAGTVPRIAGLAWTLALLIGATAAGTWLGGSGPWALPVAALVGLAVALAVVSRAVGRVGGITGDTLGAAIETATTAALVALALGASVSA